MFGTFMTMSYSGSVASAVSSTRAPFSFSAKSAWIACASTGCSGFGQIIVCGAVEAGADQVLDERLAQRQLARQAARLDFVLLRAHPRLADAAVLAPHQRVDARVLGDGEEVRRELAVVEQVEEALHVGEVAALAHLLRAGGDALALAVVRGASRAATPSRTKRKKKLPNSRCAAWCVANTLYTEKFCSRSTNSSTNSGRKTVVPSVLGRFSLTQPMPFSARYDTGWIETFVPVSALQ